MPLAQKKIDLLLEELGPTAFAISPFRVHQIMRDAEGLLQQGTSEDAGRIYHALAQGYSRLEQRELAFTAFRKASRLDAANPYIKNGLGVGYFASGEPSSALEQWVQALDLLPETENDPTRAVIFANIAEAFAVLGKPDYASEALAEAIRLAPKADANALALVAMQAAHIDEDDAALELLAQAFAIVRGVPRGDAPARTVVLETSDADRLKFALPPVLERLLARMSAFPELEHLPVVPRGNIAAVDGARDVFDEFRASRDRATDAAMEHE